MPNQHTFDPATEPPCTTEEGKLWRRRFLSQRRTNRQTSELLRRSKEEVKSLKKELTVKQKKINELEKFIVEAGRELLNKMLS